MQNVLTNKKKNKSPTTQQHSPTVSYHSCGHLTAALHLLKRRKGKKKKANIILQ